LYESLRVSTVRDYHYITLYTNISSYIYIYICMHKRWERENGEMGKC
jgi:hypothetical protein